jgi:hypothetical protein
MIRLLRTTVACIWAVCLLGAPARAWAEPPLPQLVQRLEQNKDFRVRTQAALALGASKKKDAVGPLCRALSDESQSVRTAVSAALGRLALGGAECLKKRQASEKNGTVLAAIKKALTRVDGAAHGADSAEAAIGADTAYYVAIGKLSNKTGRKNGAVEKMVREGMRKAARDLGDFAIAPDAETEGQAKKVLSKHKKLKAYYLLPKIDKPQYAGGNLKIEIEVAMFSYPNKAMIGSYSVRLTQQSVPAKDLEAEDMLIQMLAERAMEKFAKSVGQLE